MLHERCPGSMADHAAARGIAAKDRARFLSRHPKTSPEKKGTEGGTGAVDDRSAGEPRHVSGLGRDPKALLQFHGFHLNGFAIQGAKALALPASSNFTNLPSASTRP